MSDPDVAAGSSPDDPFGLCGTTIGDKYRVTSVIGKGGFGVVYRGVHVGFGEPIAIKCLKLPGELGPKERDELLARLQDEGRVLHRLSKASSGIVQALDVGAVTTERNQWVPYLVLEWLEGETLAQHLQKRMNGGKGPFSIAEAIAFLEPAARALEVAHRQKVAHRDVKPENLYLTKVSGRRTIKVLDFGIAKVLAAHAQFTAAPAATQKATNAFTPSYGAPEQFNKKRGATGPWTDVFALALIYIELVSGERALHGDDATQLYIAAADPASRPTLRYHGVETSDAVEEVLSRALAIEPADRFQDVGAFWDALRQADGKGPPAADPKKHDTSETGDFISKHDFPLDPTELSNLPTRAAPKADTSKSRVNAAAAKPDVGKDTRREVRVAPSAAPFLGGPLRGADGDPPSADESPHPEAMSKAVPRSVRPKLRSYGNDDDERRGRKGEPHSTGEPAASGKWMPIVVLLAIAGAAALYLQLRGIGRAETYNEEPSANASTKKDRTGPGPRAKPQPSASNSAVALAGAGGGGGIGGGEAGHVGGAGGGAPAAEAPEGMAFLAPRAGAEHGFFFDKREVTLGAYRRCVMAGRCLAADRIVLEPAAVRALGGVDGVEDHTTPEQHADMWGPRCNERRNELEHPVNCVNHGSSADYCSYVGKRLPTSAEWTQAAAGADGRRYPWGGAEPSCAISCFGLNGGCHKSDVTPATCACGARSGDVTPERVMDMGGNVAEWVSDESDAGSSGPAWRLLRGGSFADDGDMLASNAARGLPPVTAHVSIGFRCAKDAPAGFVLSSPGN